METGTFIVLLGFLHEGDTLPEMHWIQARKEKESMKKLWSAARISTLMLMFAMLFGVGGSKAEAAPPSGQVSSLKQTEAGKNSVTVTFSALLDNKAEYEIQLSDSKSGTYKAWKEVSNGEADLYDIPSAGTSYFLRVVPFYEEYISGTGFVKEYGTPSDSIEVVTAPSAKPGNLKHTGSTETSVSLSWSPVDGANGYEVRYKDSSARDDIVIPVADTNVTLSKLGKNSEYEVDVYPVRKSGAGFAAVGSDYAHLYGVPVLPGKAQKPACEYYWQNLGEIRADFESMQCSDGFQWEVWTAYQPKDKKVKSKDQGSGAAFISYKGFKKYSFFKIRVRAYCITGEGKKLSGKWSDWTYFCPQPEIIKLKSTKSGISLKWSTIKGADRYEVYVSTKQKSGFKKCASTKKTSLTVKKFGKSSFKNGKKYYFYVDAYNKAGKKMYSGLAGNATDRWDIKYKK